MLCEQAPHIHLFRDVYGGLQHPSCSGVQTIVLAPQADSAPLLPSLGAVGRPLCQSHHVSAKWEGGCDFSRDFQLWLLPLQAPYWVPLPFLPPQLLCLLSVTLVGPHIASCWGGGAEWQLAHNKQHLQTAVVIMED